MIDYMQSEKRRNFHASFTAQSFRILMENRYKFFFIGYLAIENDHSTTKVNIVYTLSHEC